MNALTGVFCPHRLGDHHSCGAPSSAAAHKLSTADNSAHDRMHERMPDMDMSATEENVTVSDNTALEEPVARENSQISHWLNLIDREDARAIDQPIESCSHCIMHQGSNESLGPRISASNSSGHDSIPSPIATQAINIVPPSASVVELHDNGPPGLQVPLYISVNILRI